MRLFWTGFTGLLAAAVLAPGCLFLVILLAGPHASILPGFLQAPVVLIVLMIFLAVPIALARIVWRRLPARRRSV